MRKNRFMNFISSKVKRLHWREGQLGLKVTFLKTKHNVPQAMARSRTAQSDMECT